MPAVVSLPQYQIVVVSITTGQTTAIYDPASFYSLRYNRLLNDIGELTIELPYNAANRAAFGVDTLIQVWRTNPVTNKLAIEDTYLARLFNRYRQGNIETLTIGGWHLNHLIDRRVIDPADDPNAAGGYSTYAGAADTVMYDYAYYNMGAGASLQRQFPNLTIPVPAGSGALSGYRLRFDRLFQMFQDCASKGNVDFNIQNTSGNNLELDIAVIGSDNRLSVNYPWHSWTGFDTRRGNLQDPNLMIDRKGEQTFVYALGQGQDVNRQLLKIAGDSLGDSPLNRIEYCDQSSNTKKGDATGLLTAARASLKSKTYTPNFQFKMTSNLAGNVYQQDWFLGDKITCIYDDFQQDLRITGVEVFTTQSGEVITPKVQAI